MRIALVIFRSDPMRGGAERYTEDLARDLRRMGHTVDVLASDVDARKARQRRSPDAGEGAAGEAEAKLGGLVQVDAAGLTRARRHRDFLDNLDRRLAETQYDVVHAMLPVNVCDIYHPHAGIAADAVAGDRIKHKTPLTRAAAQFARRFNVKRRAFAQVERAMLEAPDGPVVLCLSEYVKRSLRAHYTLAEDRITTVLNGIDVERFDPDAPELVEATREARRRFCKDEQGTIIALMVAQDFARKGVREAVSALAKAPDKRLRLLVVGRDERGPYERAARSLGVADRVLFTGPARDTRPFYRMADFFVLPTRHDPCSLVALEALAMGLPMVSTRANGATEAMHDGREGYILDSADDVDGLAQRMQALTDPALRARMSAAAHGLRGALSRRHHVAKVMALYHRITERKLADG